MTIKEIAELCGVDQSTVWRWAQKADDLLQNAKGLTDDPVHFAQGLAVKLADAKKSGTTPADFTLEETLTIIGEGGENKALASLLAENAMNKTALTVRNEQQEKLMQFMEKLPEWAEWYEKHKDYPARLDKFREKTIEKVKELAGKVEGAYKEVFEHATSTATDNVIEYLVSSHKPSALEAQIADLKNFLALTIYPTLDKRDKLDLFRIYPDYERKVSNPMPRETFAAFVGLLYPQIKVHYSPHGIVFSCIKRDF